MADYTGPLPGVNDLGYSQTQGIQFVTTPTRPGGTPGAFGYNPYNLAKQTAAEAAVTAWGSPAGGATNFPAGISAPSTTAPAAATPSTLTGTGAKAATYAWYNPADWVRAVGAGLASGAARVGIGFLGLILMAGALFIFANRSQIVQNLKP